MSVDLFLAVVEGDVARVEAALRGGADPNVAPQGDWGMLWALRMDPDRHSPTGRQHIVRQALEQGGGDVPDGEPFEEEDTNRHTRTPLLLAAEMGETEVAELLLDHGADPNTADEDGWTPLLFAVRRGNALLLRSLLMHGADPNISLAGQHSALFLASRFGFAEGVDRLLNAGADPNAATEEGITPLMAAASFGHAPTFNGPYYPFDDAINAELAQAPPYKPQHIATLEMLLNARANPNAVGHGNPINEGDTALKFACLTGIFTPIHLLLNAGADINFKGGILATPFICAVCSGKRLAVSYLRERGADIHATSADGLTPLMCAARGGHTELVRYLLELGAAPNARRDDGDTALFFAVNGGHAEAAQALLDGGAAVDTPDRRGRTALMLAAHKGNIPLVELFLEYGANPNLRCDEGKTALGWAETVSLPERFAEQFEAYLPDPDEMGEEWDADEFRAALEAALLDAQQSRGFGGSSSPEHNQRRQIIHLLESAGGKR